MLARSARRPNGRTTPMLKRMRKHPAAKTGSMTRAAKEGHLGRTMARRRKRSSHPKPDLPIYASVRRQPTLASSLPLLWSRRVSPILTRRTVIRPQRVPKLPPNRLGSIRRPQKQTHPEARRKGELRERRARQKGQTARPMNPLLLLPKGVRPDPLRRARTMLTRKIEMVFSAR